MTVDEVDATQLHCPSESFIDLFVIITIAIILLLLLLLVDYCHWLTTLQTEEICVKAFLVVS